MSFFVSEKDSNARMCEAENALRNRAEFIQARSLGQISQRDLIKARVFTASSLLVPIHGLSPFANSAWRRPLELKSNA